MQILIALVMLLVCPLMSAGTGDTLRSIQARGYLKCGVSTGLPGFSYIDSQGQWQGFDVDFCRAIAAAIFADAKKVEFMPLDSKSRFAALAAREVDVLIRNTTWNFTREASLNVLFPAVIFYDGQAVLVRKSVDVQTIHELSNASICLVQGTTSEINLDSYMTQNRAKFKPIYFERSEQMIRSYEAGRCDAISSDRSQLHVLQSVMSQPDAHIILDQIISKEPLSPVVRDDDVDFFKVVRWVILATIQAEEWGLNKENYLSMSRENPDIQQFLGMTKNAASAIGLPQRFAVQIITQVGNYGEIYTRNLGENSSISIKRERNALWTTPNGLMYAMPSR